MVLSIGNDQKFVEQTRDIKKFVVLLVKLLKLNPKESSDPLLSKTGPLFK